jgi:hypothetical protein
MDNRRRVRVDGGGDNKHDAALVSSYHGLYINDDGLVTIESDQRN